METNNTKGVDGNGLTTTTTTTCDSDIVGSPLKEEESLQSSLAKAHTKIHQLETTLSDQHDLIHNLSALIKSTTHQERNGSSFLEMDGGNDPVEHIRALLRFFHSLKESNELLHSRLGNMESELNRSYERVATKEEEIDGHYDELVEENERLCSQLERKEKETKELMAEVKRLQSKDHDDSADASSPIWAERPSPLVSPTKVSFASSPSKANTCTLQTPNNHDEEVIDERFVRAEVVFQMEDEMNGLKESNAELKQSIEGMQFSHKEELDHIKRNHTVQLEEQQQQLTGLVAKVKELLLTHDELEEEIRQQKRNLSEEVRLHEALEHDLQLSIKVIHKHLMEEKERKEEDTCGNDGNAEETSMITDVHFLSGTRSRSGSVRSDGTKTSSMASFTSLADAIELTEHYDEATDVQLEESSVDEQSLCLQILRPIDAWKQKKRKEVMALKQQILDLESKLKVTTIQEKSPQDIGNNLEEIKEKMEREHIGEMEQMKESYENELKKLKDEMDEKDNTLKQQNNETLNKMKEKLEREHIDEIEQMKASYENQLEKLKEQMDERTDQLNHQNEKNNNMDKEYSQELEQMKESHQNQLKKLREQMEEGQKTSSCKEQPLQQLSMPYSHDQQPLFNSQPFSLRVVKRISQSWKYSPDIVQQPWTTQQIKAWALAQHNNEVNEPLVNDVLEGLKALQSVSHYCSQAEVNHRNFENALDISTLLAFVVSVLIAFNFGLFSRGGLLYVTLLVLMPLFLLKKLKPSMFPSTWFCRKEYLFSVKGSRSWKGDSFDLLIDLSLKLGEYVGISLHTFDEVEDDGCGRNSLLDDDEGENRDGMTVKLCNSVASTTANNLPSHLLLPFIHHTQGSSHSDATNNVHEVVSWTMHLKGMFHYLCLVVLEGIVPAIKNLVLLTHQRKDDTKRTPTRNFKFEKFDCSLRAGETPADFVVRQCEAHANQVSKEQTHVAIVLPHSGNSNLLYCIPCTYSPTTKCPAYISSELIQLFFTSPPWFARLLSSGMQLFASSQSFDKVLTFIVSTSVDKPSNDFFLLIAMGNDEKEAFTYSLQQNNGTEKCTCFCKTEMEGGNTQWKQKFLK
eukprot:m.143186 g.143186  ORF g.143186 m.143186 type:complete len:1084 (-) comp13201_c0_seq2:100-3351(-)